MRTFYFDECTSHKLASFIHDLREHGASYDIVHVQHASAHGLKCGMPDLTWMPIVAPLGWIVVTVDNNIRRSKVERAERERLQLRVVYLPEVFAKWRRLEQAVFLLSAWPAIVDETTSAKPGECFDVQLNKRVKKR